MPEIKLLEKAIVEIEEIARGFGLDFYPMRYEICPAHIIYTFGAYGMPTRFSHWSFGKQFYKMKLHDDLGLSKIYELVINSNPCYAFLLDTNTLIQNKLIVAHVVAHSDFFKNNIHFQHTRGDMVESMAAAAERIKYYERKYGKEKVEKFLDAILSIQEHIDPYKIKEIPTISNIKKDRLQRKNVHVYDKNLELVKNESERKTKKETPPPEKDILLFIEKHSRILEDWQCDILTTLREEMIYFWPQLETKIMNEGWASYWHQRILRELDLTEAEAIEYAKLNATVVQPAKTYLNPYYLGLKIFEHIENQYNHPTEEMKKQGVKPHSGRGKIFEVREMDHDLSFIRNYLTKELVVKEDLFLYQKQDDGVYRITDKEFEEIQNHLIASRTNGGFPYIVVQDGNYLSNGELYLLHQYEGLELDIPYLEHVLPYVYNLWGKSVHVESVIDGKKMLISYNGIKHFQRQLYN